MRGDRSAPLFAHHPAVNTAREGDRFGHPAWTKEGNSL
jgi:hypothetical protein